jgi:hypothetical protein
MNTRFSPRAKLLAFLTALLGSAMPTPIGKNPKQS